MRDLRHLSGSLLICLGLTVLPALGVRADAGPPWAPSRTVRHYALRLRPGDDLLASLREFARARGLRAGFVASCAGSATRTSIRYANQPAASVRDGHFEIVALTGTLTQDGAHLHVAFADSTGAAFGGHLMEGTRIYTTAEIVLGELMDVEFAREPDSTYGYRELVPRARSRRVSPAPGR
jgi:predicted DNA-binding protein with PD1-like motif